MANSYFELEADSAEENWREVRAFRARPPEALERTLDGRRGSVFHSGLEQAQQQCRAAAQVGYESRPVNLFYGLSQAGRALAAASPRLRSGAWEGNAHGLRFSTNFPKDIGFLAAPLQLRPSRADTLSRTAIAIGTPVCPGVVTLKGLLSCVPEIVSRYGPFGTAPTVLMSPTNTYPDPFITSPHSLGVLHDLHVDPSLTLEQARQVRALYPALAGLPDPPARTQEPRLVQLDGTPARMPVHVSGISNTVRDGGSFHLAGSVLYRQKRWLLPAIGKPAQATHPLLVWWLILYTCSVMSRYNASDWTDLLQLHHSRDASLLEYTLDLALTAVPDVIAAALRGLDTAPALN